MTPRRDVEFTSHGATLRGWLSPADPTPAPGIVMAHGLSAVKEMFLDEYATVFTDAGFTTLVYDHFGFGASDGEPRQSPSPEIQLQGYRDAVAWLGGQPGVDADRIGVWGSSFSGGHVIVLAADDTIGIAAAVAQVPFLGEGSGDPPSGFPAAFAAGLETPGATIPVTTPDPDGVGVIYADGAHQWFHRVAADRAPSWRNEILVEGLLGLATHRPFDHLTHLRVPLLVIAAPDDGVVPPAPLLALDPRPDKLEVVEIPGAHFDAYEACFETTSQAALSFFQRHLGSGG